MAINVRPCDPAEFDTAIELIDSEFLISRGRSGSVETRFPEAISRSASGNILVGRMDGRIASALVVRRFSIRPDAQVAMIGMVCTRPEHRGRGLASSVLQTACTVLNEEGCSFAVIWTTKPAFYECMGWISSDTGCIASVRGQGNTALAGGFDQSRITAAAKIRESCASFPIHRSRAGWETRPLHADTVEIFLSDGGYALSGTRGNDGFIYELYGPPSSWPSLWQRVEERYQHITVNGQRGGDWENWLAREHKVHWHLQSLAMYRPLKAFVPGSAGFRTPYLPLLDRI